MQTSIAFAAKRELSDHAVLRTIKLPIVLGEALDATAQRIHDAVGTGRLVGAARARLLPEQPAEPFPIES